MHVDMLTDLCGSCGCQESIPADHTGTYSPKYEMVPHKQHSMIT